MPPLQPTLGIVFGFWPLLGVEWADVLVPSTPVLEILVRGTLMYWALFLLLRFAIRREVGEFGITDLLVVVLLADAAQNALAGDYQSVPDGIVLVSVIAFWAFLIDWLSYRFPAFERFARPESKELVRRGRLVRRNLARQLVSESELYSLLRQRGIEDLSQVKSMRMESDGNISVITFEGRRTEPPERPL